MGVIMKISEVPQDDIKTLNGVKKALYAVDDQGCYAKTTTGGWEAEEVVLNQVIFRSFIFYREVCQAAFLLIYFHFIRFPAEQVF